MEQKLPHGLVMVSRVHQSEILGPEKLDDSVIKNLWQTYYISRRTSNDETEHRLESLFWRVWSSRRLSGSINVRTLDTLISRIMASKSLQLVTSQQEELTVQSETKAPPDNAASQQRTAAHSQSKSQPANGTKGTLPSILKKPRTAQSEPQKTTRLLLEKPNGQSITRIPSNRPSPNMSELNFKEDQSRCQGHKTCVAARDSRHPPLFKSHRSSQTSISRATSPIQQSANAPKPFESFDPLYDDDFVKPARNPQPAAQAEKDIGTSWTDLDPLEMSVPAAQQQQQQQQHIEPVTSQDISLMADHMHPPKQPEISPAVIAMSDKQDPILPQGIETVSDDPQPQEPQHQSSEPRDPSSSEPKGRTPTEPPIESLAEPTDVSGGPGAKRVPMPESMLNELVGIVNNPEPLDELIPLPDRPWFLAEHAWLPLSEQQFLFDWMIQDGASAPNQPSNKELVEKDFRKDFAEQQKQAHAAAREASISLIIVEEGEKEEWQDDWDSDTPLLVDEA